MAVAGSTVGVLVAVAGNDVFVGVAVVAGVRVEDGVFVAVLVFVGVAVCVLLFTVAVGVGGGAFGSTPGGFSARYLIVSSAVTPRRQSTSCVMPSSHARCAKRGQVPGSLAAP